MTIQQEAYKRIDEMTEDGVRILIDIIDKMRFVSLNGFKNNDDIKISDISLAQSKAEKKKRFLESAGKIQIDGEAVRELRERSQI